MKIFRVIPWEIKGPGNFSFSSYNLRMTIKKSIKQNTIYHKPARPLSKSGAGGDGSIWAKGKMVAGKSEGYWEWFRKPARTGENGVIMRSGYFKNNKQVGEWITYDKIGKVYKITHKK